MRSILTDFMRVYFSASGMCTENCQTFLWGGSGFPVVNDEAGCSCVCEDKSWSNLNLLGRASCVPRYGKPYPALGCETFYRQYI